MNVSEAINTRQSVRAYTDEAVSLKLLQGLLQSAGRSPSGGNLQPWNVHVLTGAAREALAQAVYARGELKCQLI